MQKRGFSHIEVISAFIIFIGALIFALYFFSPLHSNKLTDSSLGYAFDEIEQNISTELLVYSIILNNTEIRKYHGGNVERINIEIENPENEEVRVENYSGSVLSSKKSAGGLGKSIVSIQWTDNNLASDIVIIKLNEDFIAHPNPPQGNLPPSGDYYKISSANAEKIISEKKALNLNNTYYSNYDALKEGFNLKKVDFGFIVIVSPSEIITATKSKPRGEVFSENRRKEILKFDGELVYGDLVVSVW